jgi:hypothetical protein
MAEGKTFDTGRRIRGDRFQFGAVGKAVRADDENSGEAS